MVIRAIALCLVIVASCVPGVHAEVKSVVAIFGGEARTPAYAVFDGVFRKALGASAEDLVYYEEYLDNARFPGPGHERQLADYMRQRYAGKQIDVVIAVDPSALQFLLKYRQDIYPGVPVVFTAVRGTTLARLQLPPDFIGVATRLDPMPTIRMAFRLRSHTREVVVVTGTADLDLAWDAAIRAIPLPSGVKMRSLTGLSIAAIERELAALAPDAIVITGSFRSDGAGRTFPGVLSVLDRLRAVSRAPIFHMYDTGVGRGAVASFSVTNEAIADQAAVIARQLLAGIRLADVTLPAPATPMPFADWRELRRWGIDERLLPAETVVRFRDPSFWDRYQYHVIAVIALLLLETALVAGLLLQHAKRRSIEARLRQSEQTMQLAANAAQLVMWNWDISRDEIWISDDHHPVAKTTPPGHRALARLLTAVHGEDREAVQRAIGRAIDSDGIYESEYRVVGGDGNTRWYAGRGRVEYVNETPHCLRGITLDITRRKEAELDAQQQRNELAHLSRVTMLGELSGSMAHELNQPLMAILSNAQAARMFISRETVDLVELGAILDDIVENDKRAGEIIWGLRKMLKKEHLEHAPLGVNDVVQEVLRLMRSDLMNRGVAVETRLAEAPPEILGDRTQLQQVLLNLILNACDAMAAAPKAARILAVRTEIFPGTVSVSVADRGGGIAAESMSRIFTSFFTTKKHGLGLGLSVCNSIITAHGGELRVANNTEGGATFTFELSSRVAAFA
jgi:signal transduction histidine kinase